MTQSIDPAMFWVAQHVDHMIPTVHPYKEQIQQALSQEFHERFPKEDLSQYLSVCMRERRRALDALARIPNARSADGTICYLELIKNALAIDPNLSNAEPSESFDPGANLLMNRTQFCDTVFRIAKYVNGKRIFPGVLESEVANVQRHILPHDNTEFFHHPHDFWDLILQILLITFHLEEDLFLPSSLDETAYNILRECHEVTLNQVDLEVYRQIPVLLHKSSRELFPAILGHEDDLQALLQLFLTNSQNIEEAVDNLADFLALSSRLPDCATEEEFKEKVIQQGLKRECDDLVYYFGDNLTLFFEYVPRAKAVGKVDLHEIWFWAANRYSFGARFEIPPNAEDFILRTLRKQICEGASTPKNLAFSSTKLLERLVLFARNHNIDAPTYRQTLRHRAALIAAQGDMVWRTQPLKADLDGIEPFENEAPILEAMRSIYEKYRNADPLLKKNQILEELQREHLLDDEGMKIVTEYLKYLWYTRPPDRLWAVPTVRLFLEWHGSDILVSTPTISLQDLSLQLRSIVDRLIPAYPVSDYDIRQVAQQLYRS